MAWKTPEIIHPTKLVVRQRANITSIVPPPSAGKHSDISEHTFSVCATFLPLSSTPAAMRMEFGNYRHGKLAQGNSTVPAGL